MCFLINISSSLVGYLASAINGSAICQGTSFLKDSLGKQIFKSGINIVDDPHIKRGLASRVCDVEGIEAKKLNDC